MANQILPTLRVSNSTQATLGTVSHPSTNQAQRCLTSDRTRTGISKLISLKALYLLWLFIFFRSIFYFESLQRQSVDRDRSRTGIMQQAWLAKDLLQNTLELIEIKANKRRRHHCSLLR